MSSELSLLFYIIAFSVSAGLLSLGIKKRARLILWTGLLIPILISGFRYGVGTDYFNYIGAFNSHTGADIEKYIDSNGIAEIGYFLIEKLSYAISGDARIVFLITSYLVVTFFYLGLRRYKLKYPGLIFFLYLMTIFPMTMNAVRQGAAMSIVFFAFTFILDKSLPKYILLILAAGLFHVSALLLLPFYFVGRFFDVRRKDLMQFWYVAKSRYLLRIGFITIVLLLVIPNLFPLVLNIPGFEKYELYLTSSEEGSNYIFYVRLFLLTLLAILAKYTIFKINYRQNAFIFGCAIVEVIILILGFTSPFIKRESLYFTPFLIMLLPNLIDTFGLKIRYRTILYAVCVLYGISFFVVSFLLLGQSDILPYDSSIRSTQ